MTEANKRFEAAAYAFRALRREVLGFRFDYPLDIDLEAGPKESLHYYVYSEKLSWSVMSMDATGIPRARNRLTGVVYKPAYIAWWGLVNLGHFLRHGDEGSRDAFLKQVEWLESHAAVRDDGSVVWFNNYDCLQGRTLLKAPWVSAYDQGLVISALVRGYRITRRPRLLELLQGASRIFEIDVRDGGVRDSSSAGNLYSELPGCPLPGIQDGLMTALLGLYDLSIETGDPSVEHLFHEGITGLKANLPAWDYRRRWSWYGSHAYLCPPSYHWQNRALLEILGRLTGDPLLSEYAELWQPNRLSALGRAEVFVLFLVTKNASRIRNRTWRLTRAKVRALASEETQTVLAKAAPRQYSGVAPDLSS